MSAAEDEVKDSPSSSHKRRHKHKKKHRRRRTEEDDNDQQVDVLLSPVTKPAIKLKFKFGGKTFGEKSVMSPKAPSSLSVYRPQPNVAIDDPSEPVEPDDSSHPPSITGAAISDEEEEWLDALEKGNLDDLGMLKRSRDPNLMTARQRALVHGVTEGDLHELPSGYKNTLSSLTEEQLQLKQQKADKRKQVALEKREKDKKLTMERLLKKQEAKLRVAKSRLTGKPSIPRFQFKSTRHNITVSVPHGHQLPLHHQTAPRPPKPVLCGVTGCTNLKKYACSQTNVPLCSLQCYKLNMLAHSKSRGLTSR